jgi:RNA polymerase sigma-70 factor (ECF subfamily)
MARVRAGEVRFLSVLFERHHQALFRYSLRMCGNRAQAEDLLQEIFMRVLKYRETFRDGHLFLTWVYRIARNAYLDQSRKGRWEVYSEEPVDRPVRDSDVLEQQQDLALLRRALQRLPEAHREILVLARFQELPYEQISELLGIEVATVKTRVHRATKQLRDIYFQLTGRPHVWKTA